MSAPLLDDLLGAFAAPTPAKPANPAKSEHPCGLADFFDPANGCEFLRISAKATPDSQEFAALRKPETGAQSQQPCGFSQNSQLSQGWPATCAPIDSLDHAAVAWTAADIAAFLDRRARLLRWGWTEAEAEKLAERLTMLNRADDDRVSCADCSHYRPGRCGNHRMAGLHGSEVGRDLAALPQHCPGYRALERDAS